MLRKLSILPLALCLWGCDTEDDGSDLDEARQTRQEAHEATKENHVAAVFAKLDTDQSGTISPQEAEGHIAHALEKGDLDGDGALSRDEMIALMEAHHGECGHGEHNGDCPHDDCDGDCPHGKHDGDCPHGDCDGDCPHGKHGEGEKGHR